MAEEAKLMVAERVVMPKEMAVDVEMLSRVAHGAQAEHVAAEFVMMRHGPELKRGAEES